MGVINEICRNCTLGNLLLPISTFGSLMFPFLVPGNLEKATEGLFFQIVNGKPMLPIHGRDRRPHDLLGGARKESSRKGGSGFP